MASIWELYVYGRYMGAICIWPYKSLPYIPYKPRIGETGVPGIYLFVDKMHVHNR